MATHSPLKIPSLYLRQARSQEIAAIKKELEIAGLPTLDISDKMLLFGLYTNEDELIGTGGLELFAETALLRSVSIQASYRNKGYGKYLVRGIETFARNKGVAHLYLLTTTAGSFFESHSYQAVDRATAPEQIRKTAEFAGLCPSSAVFMYKKLVSLGL